MNGKISLQKSERKNIQKFLIKSGLQHVHDSLPEHEIAHIRHWTIMVVLTTITSAFFKIWLNIWKSSLARISLLSRANEIDQMMKTTDRKNTSFVQKLNRPKQ